MQFFEAFLCTIEAIEELSAINICIHITTIIFMVMRIGLRGLNFCPAAGFIPPFNVIMNFDANNTCWED